MDVLFPAVPVIALQQQLLGDLNGHIQVEHQVRPGDAQLLVLKVLHPGKVPVPLLPGDLAHLVHHVGGGVPVAEDELPLAVVLAPVLAEAGKAVHRVKGAGGVGVHVLGGAAELPV